MDGPSAPRRVKPWMVPRSTALIGMPKLRVRKCLSDPRAWGSEIGMEAASAAVAPRLLFVLM